MQKISGNKNLKFVITITLFLLGTISNFAQATSVVKEEIPVEDTRTIAEWSILSGTKLFSILMTIMFVLIITLIVLADVIKNLLRSDKFKSRMKDKIIKTVALCIGFSLIGNMAEAASKSDEANSIIQLSDTMFWVLVSINAVLLLVIWYMVSFLKWVMREMNPIVEEKMVRETYWSRMMVKLTAAVPVENEATVLTDHEYDGIRELDNDLPPWWVWGFYCTIVFAVVYLMHFHVFKTGDLQIAEYNKEIANAEMEVAAFLKSQANNVDEFSVVVLNDKSAISEGKSIFETNCWQCHKKDGGGQTGPNLTDNYWIHGGDIKDMFKTIKWGVTSKSMPSWKDQLTPVQIQKVASYVHSLKGTKPAEPKAAEGELYTEKKKAIKRKEAMVEDTLKQQ